MSQASVPDDPTTLAAPSWLERLGLPSRLSSWVPDWLPAWAPWALFAASLAMLLALPLMLARLPADHFAFVARRPSRLALRHPLLYLVLRIVRNLIGLALVLLGIAMLVLPGQGLLAILLGLGLSDVPGRRRVELALVRRPAIWKALQRLRAWAGARPFEEPPPAETPNER